MVAAPPPRYAQSRSAPGRRSSYEIIWLPGVITPPRQPRSEQRVAGMGQDTATDPALERSATRPPHAAPRLELLDELSGELPNRLALETALEPDGQPEDGRSAAGTLGALHNAALAIAAPVPADPSAVTGLLHQ